MIFIAPHRGQSLTSSAIPSSRALSKSVATTGYTPSQGVPSVSGWIPPLSPVPALPRAWPEGSVTGLRARGGFELDIAWKDSKLTAATIRSKLGGPCKLRYAGKVLEINMKPGVAFQVNGNLKPLP